MKKPTKPTAESKQVQSGNKVGGNSSQATNAENATQIVTNSVIKGDLTQQVLSDRKEDLSAVLKEVLAALERLELKDDDKADVEIQAKTAQLQIDAKKPSSAIVSESLKNIWETLKGVATAAVASGAGRLANSLVEKIQAFF